MGRLLLLLLRHDLRLMPTQPPPDRSGLLRAQIEGKVLFLRIEQTELLALVGVDDGEDARDGFAEIGAVIAFEGQVSFPGKPSSGSGGDETVPYIL